MNLYILAIGAVLAFGTGAWTGYEFATGQHAKALMEEHEVADDLRKRNKILTDKIAISTAQDIVQLRAKQSAVNKEIRRERDKSPALNAADCAAPVGAVRVLNAARGFEDPGQSADGTATGVPATDEVGRRDADPAR